MPATPATNTAIPAVVLLLIRYFVAAMASRDNFENSAAFM